MVAPATTSRTSVPTTTAAAAASCAGTIQLVASGSYCNNNPYSSTGTASSAAGCPAVCCAAGRTPPFYFDYDYRTSLGRCFCGNSGGTCGGTSLYTGQDAYFAPALANVATTTKTATAAPSAAITTKAATTTQAASSGNCTTAVANLYQFGELPIEASDAPEFRLIAL